MCNEDGIVYSITSAGARDEVRYIGATLRPLRARENHHRSLARVNRLGRNKPLYGWMREILAGGGDVCFTVIASGIPCPDLAVVEYGEIQRHVRAGHPLLQTEGTILPEDRLEKVIVAQESSIRLVPGLLEAMGRRRLKGDPEACHQWVASQAVHMARTVKPWCGTWAPRSDLAGQGQSVPTAHTRGQSAITA